PHGPHDDLRLWILEQRSHDCREFTRRVVASVESRAPGLACEAPTVEVRNEPAGRAQKAGLSGARGSCDHDQLTRGDLQADVVEGGVIRPRVPVGDPVELEDGLAHDSTPLRSANGKSAHTMSPTATSTSPTPTGPRSAG